ncbi:enoyl-CoA hydratase-related protein [Xanthobacter aminoxidans]|uniref:Enoyl-CoA hydratase-related protein n=1 Tax=Xanthobacter aminoxidans TaxID=186280 RepID=A0ABW6ZQP0_9HYPH
MESIVKVERPADGVSLVRLNRPEARNALSRALKDALDAALLDAERASDVRVIVLTGTPEAFCAGGDIKELGAVTVEEQLAMREHPLWRTLGALRKPLVVAVDGYALGGGMEIALAADLVVASEGAVFGLPEIRLGILPGAGGTQRLVRLAGRQRALRYLLTGDRLSARAAQAMGIVCEVAADDAVAAAVALAASIAAMPPLAVRQIKEVVQLGPDASLATALALERNANLALFGTEERTRRMKAFAEKGSGRA